jgi:hypothetical protein
MTNDRPDLSSEGAPVIDKTILVNVDRNKYPVVRPSWALNPVLTDRLVVGRKVTLTLIRDRRLYWEGVEGCACNPFNLISQNICGVAQECYEAHAHIAGSKSELGGFRMRTGSTEREAATFDCCTIVQRR